MAKRRKKIIKTPENSGKSDQAVFVGVKFDQKPHSNFVGGKFIDRIYGTYQGVRLIQADGTQYTDGISTKQRRQKRLDGTTFMQTLYVTKDKRWFDNSGMPMSKPEAVEDEVQQEEDIKND